MYGIWRRNRARKGLSLSQSVSQRDSETEARRHRRHQRRFTVSLQIRARAPQRRRRHSKSKVERTRGQRRFLPSIPPRRRAASALPFLATSVSLSSSLCVIEVSGLPASYFTTIKHGSTLPQSTASKGFSTALVLSWASFLFFRTVCWTRLASTTIKEWFAPRILETKTRINRLGL